MTGWGLREERVSDDGAKQTEENKIKKFMICFSEEVLCAHSISNASSKTSLDHPINHVKVILLWSTCIPQ